MGAVCAFSALRWPPVRYFSMPVLQAMSTCRAPLQIAALMDSEYTPEEVAAIGLTPPQELAALLDALS